MLLSYWQHVASLTKMAFPATFESAWGVVSGRCNIPGENHCRKKENPLGKWGCSGSSFYSTVMFTIRMVKLDTPETLTVFCQSLMSCKAALLHPAPLAGTNVQQGTRKSGNRHLRDCNKGWEADVGKWHLEHASCTVFWCYFQEWVESLGLDMFLLMLWITKVDNLVCAKILILKKCLKISCLNLRFKYGYG